MTSTASDTTRWVSRSPASKRGATDGVTLLDRALSKARILLASTRRGVSIGPKNYIGPGCRIVPGLNGRIQIGEQNKLVAGVLLMAYGGCIEIGRGCSINPFTVLYGHEAGLKIGNHVLIAAHCVLVPANHIFADPALKIWQQGLSSKGICIEDDVWIGTGARILDGVRIGHGAVVGAGSIVTMSIPPMSVAVGNPARVVKERNK